MVVIGDSDTRRGSRDIEGSALHQADGKGLLNARREKSDKKYYHSYRGNESGYIDNVDINAVGDIY